MYFTVSLTVLYIFQFPAINGVRISGSGPAQVRLKPDTTYEVVTVGLLRTLG
jgi:hypothetical protein